MKINQEELAKKIKRIKGVLPTRTTNESEKGILFDKNCLIARDYKITAKVILSIESEERFIIPPKAMEMILNLPKGEIEVKHDGSGNVVIKAPGISTKYKTFPVEKYIMPDILGQECNSFVLDGEQLRNAVIDVLYAAKDEDFNRPVVSSICFEAKDGILNLIGLDGFRMAWNKIAYDGNFKLLIPKNTIQKLLSIGLDGEVQIAWSGNNVLFKCDDCELCALLLDGEFLNYRGLFADETSTTDIKKEELMSAVHRALISIDSKNLVTSPLKLEFENDTLRISVNQAENQYVESVSLLTPVSEKLVIGFNGRFLEESLKNLKKDIVNVHFTTPEKAMHFVAGDLITLVLPVRLRNAG